MVSCGRDNIRLWRVKEGQLRSAPVNLAEHHSMEFTDVAFGKQNIETRPLFSYLVDCFIRLFYGV
jgi:hypothetical protein